MMKISKILLGLLILSFWGHLSAASETSSKLKLKLLPTSDNASLELGSVVDQKLFELYQQQSPFEVTLSNVELPGFTPLEIRRAIRDSEGELISFALLEEERLSIFLFNKFRPLEFIVSSQGPVNPKSSLDLDKSLKKAFSDVLLSYQFDRYQKLPTANSPALARSSKLDPKAAEETRLLFRELASQMDTTFSLGAQIGMTRFASDSTSSSVVTFGVHGGYQVNPRYSLEGGLFFSSYLTGTAGARYWMPFAEEVVKLGVGLDLAQVFLPITQNSGYGGIDLTYNAPKISNGALFAGPGLFFDIPLLGASMRGELRLFFGSTTLLMGSYGLVYYL